MLWQEDSSLATATLSRMQSDNAAWAAAHGGARCWGGPATRLMWGHMHINSVTRTLDLMTPVSGGQPNVIPALRLCQQYGLKLYLMIAYKDFIYDAITSTPGHVVPLNLDSGAFALQAVDESHGCDAYRIGAFNVLSTNPDGSVKSWVVRYGAKLWAPAVEALMNDFIDLLAAAPVDGYTVATHPAMGAIGLLETSNVTSTMSTLTDCGYPGAGSGANQSPAVYRDAIIRIYTRLRSKFPANVFVFNNLNWIEPLTPNGQTTMNTIRDALAPIGVGIRMQDLDVGGAHTQYRDYIWPMLRSGAFSRANILCNWSPQTKADPCFGPHTAPAQTNTFTLVAGSGTTQADWDNNLWNGTYVYGSGQDVVTEGRQMTNWRSGLALANDLNAGHVCFQGDYPNIWNDAKASGYAFFAQFPATGITDIATANRLRSIIGISGPWLTERVPMPSAAGIDALARQHLLGRYDGIVLTNPVPLVVAAALATPAIDAVALLQTHALVPQASSATPAIDTVWVIVTGRLGAQDAEATPELDAVALLQTHRLIVAEGGVSTDIDAVALLLGFAARASDIPYAAVAVANLALVRLGAARIVSLEDDTDAARALLSLWDRVLEDELRAHDWSFAIRRTLLPARAGEVQWTYGLPADCLRILEVGDPNPADYRLEGLLLTVRSPPPLALRYLARVSDPAQWDATFTDAFAYRLAAECAETLTQSARIHAGLWQTHRLVQRLALRSGAVELAPRPIEEPSWLSSRS